jgi:transcriptional regulator with XRE-family HTH domain
MANESTSTRSDSGRLSRIQNRGLSMEKLTQHWTADNADAFVCRISSDFFAQIETKLEEDGIANNELAQRLGISPGRVSQILNNPGNPTIRNMVRCARAVGMKVAILAYDDADPDNNNGPVSAEVFNLCWQRAGKPEDLFVLEENSVDIQAHFEAIADRIYRHARPCSQTAPVLRTQSDVSPGFRMAGTQLATSGKEMRQNVY